MAVSELSEYERQRQANIAERDALLKELSLDATNAGLAPRRPKKKAAGAAASKRKSAGPRKKEEVVPRRTSSRIKGIEADSEVAKRKAEEEYEVAKEVARVKRQRVSGDLNLQDVVVVGNGWDKNSNIFVDVINRGAKPYERTFGDDTVKSTSDKELRKLREKMNGLALYEGFEPNQIKLTPERIYSMGFHPDPNKPLVFAGDKLGNMGVFDASQEGPKIKNEDEDDDDDDAEDVDAVITSFHLHTRTISAFLFSPTNPSQLYSCSYDSSVRMLDLSTSKSTEIYGPDDTEGDEPLSGVEIDPSSPSVLYFSRLDGFIGRHDTRASKSATTLWSLSDKKIGGFSINPQHPHFLATASLDRTMKLWDLRKMASWEGAGKRPSLLGEHVSRLSVSHAAFNSVGQVATSSYDDTIKIYNFENMSSWKAGEALPEETMEPSHTVRHNNQTGRWVTILRPQWQATPKDSVQRFVIGNMNRFVDVYSGSGQQLAQLGSDNITAVPAVAQFHPTNDWIAAGTASGKLCLWM